MYVSVRPFCFHVSYVGKIFPAVTVLAPLSIQSTVPYIWNEEQLTGSGDVRSLLAGVNRWALNTDSGSVVYSQHADESDGEGD